MFKQGLTPLELAKKLGKQEAIDLLQVGIAPVIKEKKSEKTKVVLPEPIAHESSIRDMAIRLAGLKKERDYSKLLLQQEREKNLKLQFPPTDIGKSDVSISALKKSLVELTSQNKALYSEKERMIQQLRNIQISTKEKVEENQHIMVLHIKVEFANGPDQEARSVESGKRKHSRYCSPGDKAML